MCPLLAMCSVLWTRRTAGVRVWRCALAQSGKERDRSLIRTISWLDCERKRSLRMVAMERLVRRLVADRSGRPSGRSAGGSAGGVPGGASLPVELPGAPDGSGASDVAIGGP